MLDNNEKLSFNCQLNVHAILIYNDPEKRTVVYFENNYEYLMILYPE